MKAKTTFGVIVANRGFFPEKLVKDGRSRLTAVLNQLGYDYIMLDEKEGTLGSVSTYNDAVECADLFKKHADAIDGIIITLPNFGDEKSVANTLRKAGLNVPVLIHAESDDPANMVMGERRDSFCGKISICNNLLQYNIPFSNTTHHTSSIDSETTIEDILYFASICKVVKGLKTARFGAVGARTNPFNTVRYSEKVLESHGISVETIDLSEIFGMADSIEKGSADLNQKIKDITEYCKQTSVSDTAKERMARFFVAVENWIKDNDLNGTAIQCWTSMQKNFGIVPCTVMSMMSDHLLPSACEVDICGTLSMYALQLAAEKPSAILDWNNNYGEDPEKAVLFHCSNIPISLLENPNIGHQEIIAKTVGKDNTYGPVFGRLKSSPFTYLRLSTDCSNGAIKGYLGEGIFTDDPLETFGGYGVAYIENLQELMFIITNSGFEHHVAASLSTCGDIIIEALGNYLGYDLYIHDLL